MHGTTRRSVWAALLMVACATGAAQDAPPTEAVRQAIGRLGAEEFSVRQAASDFLWKTGAAAEADLRTALKSSDPEVRNRAASLLDKLRAGLRPDTPPEIQTLIDQFRFGNQEARQQALGELRTKGHWSIVLALLRGEPNLDERRSLAAAVAPEAGKLIRPLMEQGKLDDAETVLELIADTDPGLAQLAAFLVVTDRIDGRVDDLKRGLAGQTGEPLRRLAMLQRAQGDLPGAISSSTAGGDSYQTLNLCSEARDWKQAADLMAGLQKKNLKELDHTAFAATFHRLAGNDAGYREMIGLLQEAAKQPGRAADDPFAEPKPAAKDDPFAPPAVAVSSAAWVLAETLLVNEQVDRAIALLKEYRPQQALVLLRRTHQVAEALVLAKVADQPLDRAWFDSLPAVGAEESQQARFRFAVACEAALVLHEVGKSDQFAQAIETLRSVATVDSDDGRHWLSLARIHWQLGRHDDALQDAAQASSQLPIRTVLGQLVKAQAPLAVFWYDWQQSQDPLLDRRQAIENAIWIAVAYPPPGKLPQNWRQQIEQAAAATQSLPAPQKGAALAALGETALVRDDRQLARALLAQSGEAAPTLAIRAGDILAGDKDWAGAEAWYRKAAAAPDAAPLAVYLHGQSLVQLGRIDEGRKLQRAAELMALSPEARLALASGLMQHGLQDDSIAQFQLVQRTAPLDSSLVANASQQIGNLVSRADPLRAGNCWEQLQLHVLNDNSTFLEPEAYVALPHVVHKIRAKGLLAQGKPEAALAELAASQRILPGDVKLVEELVPLLDKAGRKPDADKLFDAAHAIHAKLCAAYPSSSTYLNNTAWMSAMAGRRLDEALPLAKKAVELSPEASAYWDTLAEVHFQRRERPEAIAAATKARDLSPYNPFFDRRLKHFETDEPGKDAPDAEVAAP